MATTSTTDVLDYPAPMWPILERDARSVIGRDWLRWFQRVHVVITDLASGTPIPAGAPTGRTLPASGLAVVLPPQSGSLQDQAVPAPLAAGPAAVNWYVEKTAVDTTIRGSTVQVQLAWVHHGRTLTRIFPPLDDDTVGANASATTPVVVDANTRITYAVAAGSARGEMQYEFAIWVTP